MWAIQSVANSLKMQEQNEEEPMDMLGSPNESSLEDMEVAGSKMCTRVVRPSDLFYCWLKSVHCFLFVWVAVAAREAQTIPSPVPSPALLTKGVQG